MFKLGNDCVALRLLSHCKRSGACVDNELLLWRGSAVAALSCNLMMITCGANKRAQLLKMRVDLNEAVPGVSGRVTINSSTASQQRL